MSPGSESPGPKRQRSAPAASWPEAGRAFVVALGVVQTVLVFVAAALEVGAKNGTPPNVAAAVAFALLFLAPGVLAILRSNRLSFSQDSARDRKLWLLLGIFFVLITANLTVYRVGSVLGQNTVAITLGTIFFVTTTLLATAISYLVIKRNARGLEIPIDVLDVFVYATAVVALYDVIGGAGLDLSAEALGTRAWIAVGGVVLGFYLVSRVHGYRGHPFAEHILAVVAALILLYSAYSALTFRFAWLPYWPDPLLRALASGAVFLIPLYGARRRDEAPEPRRRYETYRVSLAFLGAVLLALALEQVLEGLGGASATLQGIVVALTGLILTRQYLSYLQGKRILELAKRASQRYRSVVEEALDPIVELDSEGRIVLVNSAFCREFEVSKDAVIGRRLAELVEKSPFQFDIAPEKKVPIEESHRGRSAEPANVIKVKLRTPDREKIFEATGRQSKSLDLQLIFRDVTERARLDRQIAELTERLSAEDRYRSDLLIKIIGIFEDERRRTSRSLVEGPARDVEAAAETLSALVGPESDNLDSSALEKGLRDCRAMLGRAVQNLRKAVDELRPTILEQKGLEAAVRSLTNELLRGSVSQVGFEWRARTRLSHGQENLLYSALRDIYRAIKGDAGVASVRVAATDDAPGRLRIDLCSTDTATADSYDAGSPPWWRKYEKSESGSSPGSDATDVSISPAEKIEALGGAITFKRRATGEWKVSISVPSMLHDAASQPALESA